MTDPITTSIAFISMPGGWEWIAVLLVGLLLFGRRLPEVGRSIGKTVVEFRKGIKDIDDEVNDASNPKPELPASEKTPIENDQRTVSQAHAQAKPTPGEA